MMYKNVIKLLSIQSLLCHPAARAMRTKLPLEAVEGRRSIVFDFDGTITQRDTIGAIAHHAISHWLRRGRLAAPPGAEEEARSKWKEIVDEYTAEYNLHVSCYSPAADERREVGQEEAFLESLRDVEQRSIARVSGSGFFDDLTPSDLEGFGREAFQRGKGGRRMAGAEDEGAVELRRGFGTFAEAMGSQGWKLGLVSVNWSGRFIKGVLGGLDSSAVADMDVLANEFRNGTIEGPEEVGRPLLTAHDKLEALVRVWEKQGRRATVYIGDSLTDLDCLLSAHLGIVVSDSDEGKVVQTLRRLNHVVPHVTDARLWLSKIVWARDFAEIGESGILDDWTCRDNK